MITSLLGVKLTFIPNGSVRVTSVYDLDVTYVFQPAKDDDVKMQLVGKTKGGPEELPQLMHYWIEQEQCIPGFIASVTLDCYEKNKMARERQQLT